MRRFVCVLVLSCTCALIVAAAESQQPRPSSPLPRSDAVATTYAEMCASCHGPNLEGGLGPSLVDDEWRHGAEDEDLVRSIAEGWPATGMPPFKTSLSEQQVRALVVFIREQSGGGPSFVPPGPPPPPATLSSEQHRFRLEVVLEGMGRVRHVTVGPDGYLYLALNAPGRIARLVPADH